MTQEERELLVKDLCARLPYDTMISVNDGKYRKDVKLHQRYIFDWDADRWDAKPYLRSLSSMTEEEKETYQMFFNEDGLLNTSVDVYLDWLLEGHFDFRGLIPKGLALEI